MCGDLKFENPDLLETFLTCLEIHFLTAVVWLAVLFSSQHPGGWFPGLMTAGFRDFLGQAKGV